MKRLSLFFSALINYFKEAEKEYQKAIEAMSPEDREQYWLIESLSRPWGIF